MPNDPDVEYDDGTKYWGPLNGRGQKEGVGVFKLKGSTYRGEFKKDEFHGVGIMVWEAGVLY